MDASAVFMFFLDVVFSCFSMFQHPSPPSRSPEVPPTSPASFMKSLVQAPEAPDALGAGLGAAVCSACPWGASVNMSVSVSIYIIYVHLWIFLPYFLGMIIYYHHDAMRIARSLMLNFGEKHINPISFNCSFLRRLPACWGPERAVDGERSRRTETSTMRNSRMRNSRTRWRMVENGGE